jgi:hypothetical protein
MTIIMRTDPAIKSIGRVWHLTCTSGYSRRQPRHGGSTFRFIPHRYALGHYGLTRNNVDTSLDIYIQQESPGPEKEPSWLPAPAGAFNLLLRMYWPKPEVLDLTWTIPVVERTR